MKKNFSQKSTPYRKNRRSIELLRTNFLFQRKTKNKAKTFHWEKKTNEKEQKQNSSEKNPNKWEKKPKKKLVCYENYSAKNRWSENWKQQFSIFSDSTPGLNIPRISSAFLAPESRVPLKLELIARIFFIVLRTSAPTIFFRPCFTENTKRERKKKQKPIKTSSIYFLLTLDSCNRLQWIFIRRLPSTPMSFPNVAFVQTFFSYEWLLNFSWKKLVQRTPIQLNSISRFSWRDCHFLACYGLPSHLNCTLRRGGCANREKLTSLMVHAFRSSKAWFHFRLC